MKPGTPELLKFKKLQKRLGESVRGTVGLLDLLWQRVTKQCAAGDIGRFSNEEIALLCDWDGNPDDLIKHLLETGWLDQHSEHRLVIHDWHEHAPTYLKGAFSSHGKKFASELSEAPSNLPSALLSNPPSNTPRPPLPIRTEPIQSNPLVELDESTMDGSEEVSNSAHLRPRIKAVLRHMPSPTPRDLEMVIKASMLSFESPFSENWLNDGVQGVLNVTPRPSKPFAYLRKYWETHAKKLGEANFPSRLRAIRVPPEMMQAEATA